MKVAVLCDSRATYGYSRPVTKRLVADNRFESVTRIVVKNVFDKDGLGQQAWYAQDEFFCESVTVVFEGLDDSKQQWCNGLSKLMVQYTKLLSELNPDIVILFGDRIETFGCAICCSYLGLVTAHVQAGDKSGHIDDIARMAMAKICNIHLASCSDSAERLLKLGEESFRIFDVGAPQLDDLIDPNYCAQWDKVRKDLKLDVEEGNYLLVVQHPVFSSYEEYESQIQVLKDALNEFDMPKVVIGSNFDVGFKNGFIESDVRNQENWFFVSNAERRIFLTLLRKSAALVGNSSAGILEAPSFAVPVVNIGDRQEGRIQAENIVNCEFDSISIVEKIEHALTTLSQISVKEQIVNPYGDGASSPRIADIIFDSWVTHGNELLNKRTTY